MNESEMRRNSPNLETTIALLPTPAAEMPLLPTPSAERAGRNKSASEGAEVRWSLDHIDRLLPTPRATDGTKGGPNQRGSSGDLMLPSAVAQIDSPCEGCGHSDYVHDADEYCAHCGNAGCPLDVRLIPTPSVADSTGGHERRGGARGGELLLKGVARAHAEGKLLPTPTAMDYAGSGGNPHTTGTHGTTLTDATVRQPDRWGDYGPAIRRHEAAFGRPAPEPTKVNAKGSPKLSDEFDEWLMGLPAGWITDVPGITWNEALKACGNGVVPPQAAAAVRWLLDAAKWQVAA